MTEHNPTPTPANVSEDERIVSEALSFYVGREGVGILKRHGVHKAADAAQAFRRIMSSLKAARVDALKWYDGCPDKVYGSEWFIAKLDNGEKVVLRALPEDFSYDYKTADETYYKAFRIKKWMQFPDSDFIPFKPPASPEK